MFVKNNFFFRWIGSAVKMLQPRLNKCVGSCNRMHLRSYAVFALFLSFTLVTCQGKIIFFFNIKCQRVNRSRFRVVFVTLHLIICCAKFYKSETTLYYWRLVQVSVLFCHSNFVTIFVTKKSSLLQESEI